MLTLARVSLPAFYISASQNFLQKVARVMDIISQLQEQVNLIAHLAFNTVGTLQRDAPPNRLSPNYPEPPAHATEDGSNFSEQPKLMSTTLVKAAKQGVSLVDGILCYRETRCGIQYSNCMVLLEDNMNDAGLEIFDALVAALPISESGEEAQLKRISELQAENDAIGLELQKQLEAAEKELNQVQELFRQASDNCLNLKKPDDS
ncbi:Mediator of RNA polymerase II transcription subunit 21 [Glycine soja]